jgi:hypothetical protein
MKVFLAISLLASALFAASPAYSQMASSTDSAQTAAPVANPVTSSLRMLLPRQQKNTLAAIEAMPADKFSYKPTPDQITFGHLVVHIIQSNYGMCARVAGIDAPKVELADTDPKDKLLPAAKASFDFCADNLAKVDDSKLGDTLDYGFAKGPRALGVLIIASGWADHYGAAAMYLRLNNILPPTAKPKS